jgi:hypothetical protein
MFMGAKNEEKEAKGKQRRMGISHKDDQGIEKRVQPRCN